MKKNENVFSKKLLTVINTQKCIHHLMIVLYLAKYIMLLNITLTKSPSNNKKPSCLITSLSCP